MGSSHSRSSKALTGCYDLNSMNSSNLLSSICLSALALHPDNSAGMLRLIIIETS
jgi:hypothetical protein